MNVDDQNKTPLALASLKTMRIEPDPYLSNRIILVHKERQLKKNNVFSFFMGSLATSMVALLIVFISPYFSSPQVPIAEFKVGQAYVVKIDLQHIPTGRIARTEVEILGDSFGFYSSTDAGLTEQSKLAFEWEQLNSKTYLPIVIKGKKIGSGKILVSFYNENDEKIDTTLVPLEFAGTI